jgi:hydrogenase maturation protease
MTTTLVVGLGRDDRGDDAVGPVVARAVAALGLPGVRVEECIEPLALIDLWASYEAVVVVDAVRSGARPGTVHRRRTGPERPPLTPLRGGAASSHGMGLDSVAELARALGRLPDLRVVGVEALSFEYGAPLSAPVARAVQRTVEAVLDDADASPLLPAGGTE